jgi:hypothetical protein
MKNIVLIGSLTLATIFTGCLNSNSTTLHAETASTKHHKTVTHHDDIPDLSNAQDGDKKGFLTTRWCAEQGLFRDCRLETVVCDKEGCYKSWDFGDKEKMNLVLFVHDEGKIYDIKLNHNKLHSAHLIEEAINRNNVTIKGKIDEKSNFIFANSYDAPPPPKKSFFKGCL